MRCDRGNGAMIMLLRMTELSPGPAPHFGNVEVVACARNARATDRMNGALERFHLRMLGQAVKQNVIPVRWIESLDRFPRQANRFDFPFNHDELVERPRLVLIARDAAATRWWPQVEHG